MKLRYDEFKRLLLNSIKQLVKNHNTRYKIYNQMKELVDLEI